MPRTAFDTSWTVLLFFPAYFCPLHRCELDLQRLGGRSSGGGAHALERAAGRADRPLRRASRAGHGSPITKGGPCITLRLQGASAVSGVPQRVQPPPAIAQGGRAPHTHTTPPTLIQRDYFCGNPAYPCHFPETVSIVKALPTLPPP